MRVAPAALARTLGLSTQNVLDAVGELVDEGIASIVGGSAFATIILDISTALKANTTNDSS